ncbi:MAG: hypothetical protein CTY35_00045 [Methylotenera sp.]|uniref:hypothetical protein n=1 Tax=Methylotenera sp. TaxID=2051956 RepID=UPI000D40335A|nr:hypothetical protein [Methylotenera sp.]PPC84746.1 MAG: hypothetical protein CTY38_00045 [Methylotenera sp.]PPD02105.1 MAG: hypothetical protein CTY35_00045 [Methylotenera sp.]
MISIEELAKTPKVAQLKAVLVAAPLQVVVNMLKWLDKDIVAALNHGVNKHGDAFIHQLIAADISDPSSELLLIEALTALEVESFNVYDLRTKGGFNVLGAVLDNLMVGLPRAKMGDRLIAHVANRVSGIDENFTVVHYPDIGQGNALMFAIICGDIDACRILIDHGASLKVVSGNGMSCDQIAESYKVLHPEFFLEYKALTLIAAHQQNAVSTPKRKVL